MNTQREKLRRQARLRQLAEPEPPPKPPKPDPLAVWATPDVGRPPEKLPDPWLFDSESLLAELARCRELVNQISVENANATHFTINIAVDALWRLRENLRELLRMHREGQQAFAAQQADAERKAAKAGHKAAKVIRIRAQA
jgi:hypothetical protein